MSKEVLTDANKPYVMVLIGAVTAGMIFYYAGKRVGHREAMAPKDVVICDTDDVLDGASWRVDMNSDLDEQSCEVNMGFPDKILCKREVTIACDVP